MYHLPIQELETLSLAATCLAQADVCASRLQEHPTPSRESVLSPSEKTAGKYVSLSTPGLWLSHIFYTWCIIFFISYFFSATLNHHIPSC